MKAEELIALHKKIKVEYNGQKFSAPHYYFDGLRFVVDNEDEDLIYIPNELFEKGKFDSNGTYVIKVGKWKHKFRFYSQLNEENVYKQILK